MAFDFSQWINDNTQARLNSIANGTPYEAPSMNAPQYQDGTPQSPWQTVASGQSGQPQTPAPTTDWGQFWANLTSGGQAQTAEGQQGESQSPVVSAAQNIVSSMVPEQAWNSAVQIATELNDGKPPKIDDVMSVLNNSSVFSNTLGEAASNAISSIFKPELAFAAENQSAVGKSEDLSPGRNSDDGGLTEDQMRAREALAASNKKYQDEKEAQKKRAEANANSELSNEPRLTNGIVPITLYPSSNPNGLLSGTEGFQQGEDLRGGSDLRDGRDLRDGFDLRGGGDLQWGDDLDQSNPATKFIDDFIDAWRGRPDNGGRSSRSNDGANQTNSVTSQSTNDSANQASAGYAGQLSNEDAGAEGLANGDEDNPTQLAGRLGLDDAALASMYEDELFDLAMENEEYKELLREAGYGDFTSWLGYANLGDNLDYGSTRYNVTRDLYGLNPDRQDLAIQELNEKYKRAGVINDEMTEEEAVRAIMNRHWDDEHIIDPRRWAYDEAYQAAHPFEGSSVAEKYINAMIDMGLYTMPGAENDDPFKLLTGDKEGKGDMTSLDRKDLLAAIAVGNEINRMKAGYKPNEHDMDLYNRILGGAGDLSKFSFLPDGEDSSGDFQWRTWADADRDYSSQAILTSLAKAAQTGDYSDLDVPFTGYGMNLFSANLADALMHWAETSSGRHVGRNTGGGSSSNQNTSLGIGSNSALMNSHEPGGGWWGV